MAYFNHSRKPVIHCQNYIINTPKKKNKKSKCFVFKYFNESDLRRLQEKVRLKMTQQPQSDATTTQISHERPSDFTESVEQNSSKPPQTTINVQFSKISLDNAEKKESDPGKSIENMVPEKNFKNIEAELSLNGLESEIPIVESVNMSNNDINQRAKQTTEDILTKLTSSQRSICAVIDLIL